jgi:hypothetical protein
MTKKERQFAEDWLNNVKALIEGLSDSKYFNLKVLHNIIIVEIEGKRRRRLIRRLHGRFCKVRQSMEWNKIKMILDNDGDASCWNEK